jgi:hypothetical protein
LQNLGYQSLRQKPKENEATYRIRHGHSAKIGLETHPADHFEVDYASDSNKQQSEANPPTAYPINDIPA